MKFVELPDDERHLIDALIHDAYVRPDGTTASHVEAADNFRQSLEGAQQAGRVWADLLTDQWVEDGMKRFIQGRWKHGEIFAFVHRGRARSRTVRRGVKRVSETGKVTDTQLALFEWTAADLKLAIANASRQIAEHAANIALYKDMLALLESTDSLRFADALRLRGTSWDQWLAAREADSA